MIITRLRLSGFKRHRQLEIDLGPGLNIVRGANEAGKSTIQRAIEMGLFRRPTFSGGELEELRPWGDAPSDPMVDIEFTDDGRKGQMQKVFAGQRGTVELQIADEHYNDPAAVDAQMATLTGLPSEKFFRASASVHHQELTGLNQDEDTLRDRLQQSMSGADHGTNAVRRKLEEAIRRYRTEGAKNPGYLKVMRNDVERLGDQLHRGEGSLGQLEADRRSLADARQTRIALDARLDEQREGAEKAERASALTATAADAARRYALYKRAAELREDIGRLEASHPSAVSLPALRSTVEHLRKLEFKVSEMRAEMSAEPDLSGYNVSLPSPRWRPWLTVGGVLLVAAPVVAVAGIVLRAATTGLLAAGAVLLMALGALLIGARGRLRQTDIRMQNELREAEIARRLAGRTDLGERVRQAEQERIEALSSLGLPDLAAAETTFAAETEHVTQISSRRAEFRGLMADDPTGDDVAELRDRAAAEGDEARHTLAGMGDVGREPERFLSGFQLAIQRLTPEREAAFQAEAGAEARVNANEVDAEKVAADGEALATAGESLAAAERRLRIYEDVLTTLNAAERGTMKKAARFLEQRMARDVERVTGGRYRRLKVDEATLSFAVFSVEVDDWIDVRRLSQGTLDQLYLCARLGIVRQVTQPGAPPLVFDDPFVTFDDERAALALGLLKDIARDLQVILLTHSDRYDKLADRVVVLPAPEERDLPEPLEPGMSAEQMSAWTSTALAPAAPRAPAASPKAAANNGGHGAPAEPVASGTSSTSIAPVEHAPLWPEER
ncbi:MAG: AAA family ATPase [Chloroflexota bacterium]